MLHVREIKELVYKNRDLIEALDDFDRTGTLAKANYKERVNFTIDMELMRLFREYCRKNGFKMSTKVEQLIFAEVKSK